MEWYRRARAQSTLHETCCGGWRFSCMDTRRARCGRGYSCERRSLVASLEAIALAVRHGRLPFSTELPPDGDVIAFLDDVARLAGERDALRSYVLRDS